MLIYNFQKEFVGIDEADLEVFGFANLSELKAEASDFADMFVRTPGYIHNFKHVHWIDFVTCADSSEQSKVIIEVNGKTYKAVVTVDTVYLSDNPTSKAYLINLNNLRTLTLKENGEFSEDIARKKPPRIEPTVGHAFNLSEEDEAEIEAAPELEGFKPFENIQEIDKTPETPKQEEQEELQEVQEIPPTVPLDISFDDDNDESVFTQEIDEATETETIAMEETFSLDTVDLDIEEDKQNTDLATEDDDDFDYSYNYDPQVASDELGLPIDLIEEFIQDFIAQAKEFKDELHSSMNEGDLDNVKILSHKLKGVAANLRIEDAFNTLSIINTSSDITEVEKYIHIFYKTIAKLSGEEIKTPKPTTTVTAKEPQEILRSDDDLYDNDLILDFKSEDSNEEVSSDETAQEAEKETEDDLYLDFDIDIKDSEVPEKIDMPELADDDFLNEPTEDVDDIDDIDDLLSIDEDILELKKETPELEELISTQSATEDEIVIDIEEDSMTQESEELPEFEYSKELISHEIGLDQESFDEIFNDYIEDSKSSVTSIHEAISADDFAKCKKEAIKLKGMSDNMRINTFEEELASLVNSSEKDELTKAVKKIDAVIAQISKQGSK